MISRGLKSHKLDGTANAIRKQAFRLRALLLRRFFSANAGRGRIIDLGLDVVNEPGLVRAVEFIQDGVTAETIQRAISNSVVALDFAFVEVISFRDNTETRPSVALDIVLHAFNS